MYEKFISLIDDGDDLGAKTIADIHYDSQEAVSGSILYHVPMDVNVIQIWEWDGHCWWHKDTIIYNEEDN